MIRLQRTLSYAGDSKKAALETITIVFTLPVYQYSSATSDGGGELIRQHIVDAESVTITQAITSREYRVSFSDAFPAGTDDSAFSLFKNYYAQALIAKNLDNLTARAGIRFLSNESYLLGEDSLD